MKVVCLKTTTNQLQFCIALHFFLKTGVSVMCTFLNRLLLVNAGVFLSTAFACATPVQNDDYLLGLLPQKRYNFQIRQPQSRILAKTAAMKWKQIGSTHFNNTAPIDSSVQWNIFHRDTMLYDAAGNMVLKNTVCVLLTHLPRWITFCYFSNRSESGRRFYLPDKTRFSAVFQRSTRTG
jgi:hypothetical protein